MIDWQNMNTLLIYWAWQNFFENYILILALSPATPRFYLAAMEKNWEWPGDEASFILA